MGMFEVLADYILAEIVNSNDNLSKARDNIVYQDAKYKQRVLTDAQQKAHFSGDKKSEDIIKDKRGEVQSTIDKIEEKIKNKKGEI